MLREGKEAKDGERTAVGIDPCKEFLQLAILSNKKDPVFKKLPLPAEILKSTQPERIFLKSGED